MMKLNQRTIRRLLRLDAPAPPPDLERRLKEQIPQDLFAPRESEDDREPSRSRTPARVWLAAASVVVALGAGLLALRLLPSAGEVGELPARREALEMQEVARRPAEDPAAETPEDEPKADVTQQMRFEPLPPEQDEQIATSEVGDHRAGDPSSPTSRDPDAGRGGEPAPPSARNELELRWVQDAVETGSPSPVRGSEQAEGDAATDELHAQPGPSEEASPTGRTVGVDKLNVGNRETEKRSDAGREAQRQALEDHMRRVPNRMEGAETTVVPEQPVEELARKSAAASTTEPKAKRVPGQEHLTEELSRLPSQVARADLPDDVRRRPLRSPVDPVAPPSTGGTTEPNDQPYGDMFFDPTGVNPFIDTEDDPLSTFGLDVDTASYSLARAYIERGHRPPAEAIRVEEFLNAFDYGDRAPRRGDFALYAEGAPTPFGEGPRYRVVRFGLAARGIRAVERKPTTFVFLVDVSGSMARGGRLEAVKGALHLLIDRLEPGDEVGLVTYSDSARVLLAPTGDRTALRWSVDRLLPGGSTNLEHGLTLAYDLARRYHRPGALHRIVLCSDGVANVGRTSAESILASVGAGARQGIEMSALGFGLGNYNDALLEQLANRGDGNYYYVDTAQEAHRVLVEELDGTVRTVARNARVQVEWNPEVVSRYRLLGYENRDLPDQSFRDDRVDAGEVGAEHRVSALYEIKLARRVSPRTRLATFRIRYLDPETGAPRETESLVDGSVLSGRWQGSPGSLRLAASVAELAELFKGSYWARGGSLEMVRDELGRLPRRLASAPEVLQLRRLVDQALAAQLLPLHAVTPTHRPE